VAKDDLVRLVKTKALHAARHPSVIILTVKTSMLRMQLS
jgi:hypothetical protein